MDSSTLGIAQSCSRLLIARTRLCAPDLSILTFDFKLLYLSNFEIPYQATWTGAREKPKKPRSLEPEEILRITGWGPTRIQHPCLLGLCLIEKLFVHFTFSSFVYSFNLGSFRKTRIDVRVFSCSYFQFCDNVCAKNTLIKSSIFLAFCILNCWVCVVFLIN